MWTKREIGAWNSCVDLGLDHHPSNQTFSLRLFFLQSVLVYLNQIYEWHVDEQGDLPKIRI